MDRNKFTENDATDLSKRRFSSLSRDRSPPRDFYHPQRRRDSILVYGNYSHHRSQVPVRERSPIAFVISESRAKFWTILLTIIRSRIRSNRARNTPGTTFVPSSPSQEGLVIRDEFSQTHVEMSNLPSNVFVDWRDQEAVERD